MIPYRSVSRSSCLLGLVPSNSLDRSPGMDPRDHACTGLRHPETYGELMDQATVLPELEECKYAGQEPGRR
jgi:hypothetical protein